MTQNVSFWSVLRLEAKQFCLQTALHGYRFIVLPKRILLERVFWGLVVIVSLVTALVLMGVAWATFQKDPTLLVTDSTHHPIWNYPFPTVTVCSFNFLSKNKTLELAAELSKNSGLPTEEIADQLRLLVQLFFNDDEQIPKKSFVQLQNILEDRNYTPERVLKRLAPSCSKMFHRCKWKGEEMRCDGVFEQIVTTEGFCCSFNYYALRNHRFPGLLGKKVPGYPRRVSACGYLTALEVLVNNNPEDYFATQFPAIGTKVLIHRPYDYPDWTIPNLTTEKLANHLISITPSMTYATPEVRGVAIVKRKCLFSDERQLHNFQKYTFHNCLVECRMNSTRDICGCIPFYYRNPDGTYPLSRTCDLRDIECLTRNRYYRSDCGCLPDCEYTSYAAESSSGVLTRTYSTNQQSLYEGVTVKDQSVFRVFYNDLVATRNRRGVVFSWHTLLAYYGGLLGLFIGFSFVSAIELIYFFTVRLMADYLKKREEVKKKTEVKVFNVKPQYEVLDVKTLFPQKRVGYVKRRNVL